MFNWIRRMGPSNVLVKIMVLMSCFLFCCSWAKVQIGGNVYHSFQCPKAIFGLGDSFTDTGEIILAYTGLSGYDNAEREPYGITFFSRPADRASDGRLIIDFFWITIASHVAAQAFGFPLLDPYFKSIDPNFRHGVNFAVSGVTASSEPPVCGQVPLFLPLQVNQAIRFQAKARVATHGRLYPKPDYFTTRGLYYIFAGWNDVRFALQTTPKEVCAGGREALPIGTIRREVVPGVVSNISLAITKLHAIGATQFLVWNLPPIGCSPYMLGDATIVRNPEFGPVGEDGCLQGANEVIQLLNSELLGAVRTLRRLLGEATTILLADIYSIIYDITSNPSQYGMTEAFQVCCGGSSFCGQRDGKFTVCDNPQQFVNWDGIHFTEAVYRIVATQVLSGSYIDPPSFNLTDFCHLDLSY